MKIIWSYAGRRLEGYIELLDCYGKKEFASPKRSTVPLLLYWHTADHRAKEFSRALDFKLNDPVFLDFEHEVPVQRGKGKASCTDLRLSSDGTSVVIEAKSSEPRYKDVGTWLSDSQSNNRIAVLNGWLGLLGNCATKNIKIDDVVDLPYPLVHRAASACHSDAESRWLVYQLFDVSPDKRKMYLADLSKLATLMGGDTRLRIRLVDCSVQRSDRQIELERMWDSGKRDIHEYVLAGLKAADLLDIQVAEIVNI